LSSNGEDRSIKLAKKIRRFVRVSQGLSEEDDAFNGLIHIGDVRERTRISLRNIYSHNYMRLLAKEGGDEWEIWKKVADGEDTYYIAEEGEQRKEAILMKQTSSQQPTVAINQPLSLPQVETNRPLGEPQQTQEKSHWYNRRKKQ